MLIQVNLTIKPHDIAVMGFHSASGSLTAVKTDVLMYNSWFQCIFLIQPLNAVISSGVVVVSVFRSFTDVMVSATVLITAMSFVAVSTKNSKFTAPITAEVSSTCTSYWVISVRIHLGWMKTKLAYVKCAITSKFLLQLSWTLIWINCLSLKTLQRKRIHNIACELFSCHELCLWSIAVAAEPGRPTDSIVAKSIKPTFH